MKSLMDAVGVLFAHMGARDLNEDDNFSYFYSLTPLPDGDSRWGVLEPSHKVFQDKNCAQISNVNGRLATISCAAEMRYVCEVVM